LFYKLNDIIFGKATAYFSPMAMTA